MHEKIPIFIINLKQDIHKKTHMEKLCRQYNLNCEFVEAVYGKDLGEENLTKVYNKKESLDQMGRELSKGELGCALSHISIYQHMIDNHIKQAIIFEDDIHIEKDFSSIIQNMNKFPENWEIILLGYFRGSVEKEKLVKSYLRNRTKITDTHKLVRLTEIASGTHGYIINLKGAKKLLETLKPIHLPIDHYTGDDQYINLYAVYPRVIRVHNYFAKQTSGIESERDQIKNTIHSKNNNLVSKMKLEILRPFHQLRRFLKPIRKYR